VRDLSKAGAGHVLRSGVQTRTASYAPFEEPLHVKKDLTSMALAGGPLSCFHMILTLHRNRSPCESYIITLMQKAVRRSLIPCASALLVKYGGFREACRDRRAFFDARPKTGAKISAAYRRKRMALQ